VFSVHLSFSVDRWPCSVLLLCKERDIGDEYGWKQVHGDVFRPASYSLLFSSLVGSGHQVAFVALCTITIAIVGELYTE